MQKRVLKIGITLGDPAGIGPEVALKALNSLNSINIVPVIIGRHQLLQEFYPEIYNNFEIIESDSKNIQEKTNKKFIYDIPLDLPLPVPGKGNINTGIESKIYIETAVQLWQNGLIDAVVTGPVNKGFIEKSGTPFTGHTEYIAGLINEDNPYMLMFSTEYRVLLTTSHIPISQISTNITQDSLLRAIRAGNKFIKSIDGNDITIAIACLDPHCGDNGAIGNFDENITACAVKTAKSEGINIKGPYAADTLFISEKWKKFNLIIAHFHDQGLIPFKLLAFDKGVNVTLGLSITRTSVNHGTAYNIAGKNIARHNSMIEAIKLAYMLEIHRANI